MPAGKGDAATANPPAVVSAVLKDVTEHGKKDLKHVSAPEGGLSQAEKEAYLQEKGKK